MSKAMNWRKHITAQRASGLSIGQYCEKHDISPGRWYYWQRKFGQTSALGSDFTAARLGSVKCLLEISGTKIQLDGDPQTLGPIILSMLTDAS